MSSTKSNKRYDSHKREMANKSRLRSIEGREIAPMPPVADPERRVECADDLRLFCETYFPAKFSVPFGSHHLIYIDRVRNIIKNGGKQCIAMPRGSGKTTIEKAAVLWGIAYGYDKCCVIVSASKDESISFLGDIKKMILSNRFEQDFPEISYPFRRLNGSALLARGQLYYGRQTDIVLQSDKLQMPVIPGSQAAGSSILSKSIGGTIRGKSEGGVNGVTLRPDLVIIDDPQKDEDAINPKRVDKLQSKINATLGGLGADGQDLAMILSITCRASGDLADRYLDHNLYPSWQGLRFKMIEKYPNKMDMWLNDYADLYRKDRNAANDFYRDHRAEMDEGAEVDWECNYNKKNEASRLQRAINMLIEDPETFCTERQNEPQSVQTGGFTATSRTIRFSLNGYNCREVPLGADTVTAFIDVHSDILYYCVTAFRDDRTGYIIDYGTFPEQRRDHFFKGDPGNLTLSRMFRNVENEVAIQEGVICLLHDLLGETWMSEDGEHTIPIARILIDTGYKRTPVENAIRLVGSGIPRPAKGRGIKSINRPINDYIPSPDTRIGNYWYEKWTQGRPYKTFFIDTNYWKSEVHASFNLGVGNTTSLSFWGVNPDRHLMFSEHCNAEKSTLVKNGENEVYEWQQIPGRDNHLFDCLVGCLAASSMMGIHKPGERVTKHDNGSRKLESGSDRVA